MKNFILNKYRNRDRMSDRNRSLVLTAWIVLPTAAAILVAGGVVPAPLIATALVASFLLPASYNAFLLALHTIFASPARLHAA